MSLKVIFRYSTGLLSPYLSAFESRLETIWRMQDAGFHGFLIGERFMKEQDPAIAFASFVERLKMRK